MFAVTLLAAVSRCASPALCPTDDQLVAAVRAGDVAAAEAASIEAATRDEIVLIHPRRIRRISDVICGDRLPGDLPTVTCGFTVRYWRADSYQMARLVLRDGSWRIDAALMVTRDR